MKIGPLYHWSPTERRQLILCDGLLLFQRSQHHSDDELLWPYICLSSSPSEAWSLSGALNYGEVDRFDLWQVWLPENAEVRPRAFFGDRIEEFKVYTAIPADHVWYVGTREAPAAMTKEGPT